MFSTVVIYISGTPAKPPAIGYWATVYRVLAVHGDADQ